MIIDFRKKKYIYKMYANPKEARKRVFGFFKHIQNYFLPQ